MNAHVHVAFQLMIDEGWIFDEREKSRFFIFLSGMELLVNIDFIVGFFWVFAFTKLYYFHIHVSFHLLTYK